MKVSAANILALFLAFVALNVDAADIARPLPGRPQFGFGKKIQSAEKKPAFTASAPAKLAPGKAFNPLKLIEPVFELPAEIVCRLVPEETRRKLVNLRNTEGYQKFRFWLLISHIPIFMNLFYKIGLLLI